MRKVYGYVIAGTIILALAIATLFALNALDKKLDEISNIECDLCCVSVE